MILLRLAFPRMHIPTLSSLLSWADEKIILPSKRRFSKHSFDAARLLQKFQSFKFYGAIKIRSEKPVPCYNSGHIVDKVFSLSFLAMRFVDKNRLPKRSKNIGALFRGCLHTQLRFLDIVLSKCKMKTFELMEGSIAPIETTTRSKLMWIC